MTRPCKHTIRIFYWQLETMPEYSSTIPTGTVDFKMWKRNRNDTRSLAEPDWVVGQYHPVDIPGRIGIRWFEVSYLEGPMPPGWHPPDWGNYERWKREYRENRT